MKPFLILAGLMVWAVAAAQAQDAGAEAAPAAPVVAQPKPAAVEPAKEAAPAEAAPEAKAEPKPEPKPELKVEPKPEPAPEPQAKAAAKPAKKAPKTPSPEELVVGEFQALKSGAEDGNAELRNAAVEDLRVFVLQHPEAESAPEALALLARQEDYRPAMVDWLRLAYEYPESKFAQKAKSEYLDLVNKKMRGKLQPGLSSLAKIPQAEDKAERLAQLIYGLSEKSGDALYDPAVAQARGFQVRFPAFENGDRIQWSLAQLHMAAGKNSAVLMALRKLLVYEASPYREKAQFALADLYADKFRKYKEAVDAYQDFIERYPQSEQVPPALDKIAVLYADRLEQYPLAVETYERAIKLFPKSEGALKAFRAEAKLQRERLKQPEEAVKTYQRLSEQFRYPEAAEAFISAAEVCRKDLKDYQREVELRRKVASEFPTAKEAPEQLYEAAEVTQDDLNDAQGALKLYQEVAAKFPAHKLGKKAAGLAEKLEKKGG